MAEDDDRSLVDRAREAAADLAEAAAEVTDPAEGPHPAAAVGRLAAAAAGTGAEVVRPTRRSAARKSTARKKSTARRSPTRR